MLHQKSRWRGLRTQRRANVAEVSRRERGHGYICIFYSSYVQILFSFFIQHVSFSCSHTRLVTSNDRPQGFGRKREKDRSAAVEFRVRL